MLKISKGSLSVYDFLLKLRELGDQLESIGYTLIEKDKLFISQ